jgi:hypothetical protein
VKAALPEPAYPVRGGGSHRLRHQPTSLLLVATAVPYAMGIFKTQTAPLILLGNLRFLQ